jgi:hypothetical protein
MKLTVAITTGDQIEFTRNWDVPNPSGNQEMREFLTRLQTQLNTFVKHEEEI